MQSDIASSPIETGLARLSIESNAPLSLNEARNETSCFDGLCSIDPGFSSLLRNSKGKLSIAPKEQARPFDFNSPNLI